MEQKVSDVYWGLRKLLFGYIGKGGYSYYRCQICGHEEGMFDGAINHVLACHYDESVPNDDTFDENGLRKGEMGRGIPVVADKDFRDFLSDLHKPKD